MNGVLALVGSGEFTSAMIDVDRDLLAATGRARPRVAIMPAASWPDGEVVFNRWMAQGEAHFAALGAEPVRVQMGEVGSGDDPAVVAGIAGADLVYLSGGKPGHLLALIRDTAAGAAIRAAHERGAVIAGCSAGAMVLGGHQIRIGGWRDRKLPIGWQQGLGLVPGVVIVPHYDAIPEMLLAPLAFVAPEATLIVGIDEDTALVSRAGGWVVAGRGRVTIWRGRTRKRYRVGAALSLALD